MKKYVMIGSFIVFGLLAGCNGPVSQAMAVTESVGTVGEELVAELNDMAVAEQELQAAFEKTMEEDEELESMADGSSSVFDNVEERREALEQVEEYHAQLEEDYLDMAEQDMDELPDKEVEALENSLEEVTQLLSEYTSHYEDALSEQEQFFESLADEEATYETMKSGIDDIASTDEETAEFVLQLDEQLIELENHYGALNSALEEDAS